MEKTFSKYDLLYSIKSVYLRCSPGRSSPRYQMLVMNPGFFIPCILFTKIVDGFDLRVSFSINFQVSDDPVHIRWFMPTDFLPIVMQNEVKHLSTDSSLTLRMTLNVNVYIITKKRVTRTR